MAGPRCRGCGFRGVKVAVLGAGKIGSILAKGFIECGYEVLATVRRPERLQELEIAGIKATMNNREALEWSDVAVISVKPYQYPRLVSEISNAAKNKVIVSVMAGVPLSLLEATLPGAEIYRAMPNLNALVKKSSTALSYKRRGRGYRLVKSLLECIGSVYEIPEELIDAWTATIGSGPAIVAEIIDAMILGALAVGIPRSLAYHAVLEMLVGTSSYLSAKPEHPAQLRDEVTTPGGTTIRALKTLEAKGAKAAIIDAIEKATARAKELAREIERRIKEETQAYLVSPDTA